MPVVSVSKLVEDVVHRAHATKEGEKGFTIEDLLYEASVHEYGRNIWREVYQRFAKGLREGRQYADLAGTKVLRNSLKKKEGWVQGRNLPSIMPRHPAPDWDTTPLVFLQMANEAEQFPDGSPRALPYVVRQGLRKLSQDCSIDNMVALSNAWFGEWRVAQSAATAAQQTITAQRDVQSLTQRLLRYMPDAEPDAEAEAETRGATH